jgi:hypothetical protein
VLTVGGTGEDSGDAAGRVPKYTGRGQFGLHRRTRIEGVPPLRDQQVDAHRSLPSRIVSVSPGA